MYSDYHMIICQNSYRIRVKRDVNCMLLVRKLVNMTIYEHNYYDKYSLITHVRMYCPPCSHANGHV